MYKTHTRVNRNQDNVITSQIDFAREQEKKNRTDLEKLEEKFSFKKTDQPIIEKFSFEKKEQPIIEKKVTCNCPDEPIKICEYCGGEIPKKGYYPDSYRKMKYCGITCRNAGVAKNRTQSKKIDKPEPIFLQIPLKSGVFDVTEKYATLLEKGFPERNVRLELEKIKQWNEANPTRRKTESGIKKHIFSWLNRDYLTPQPEPVKEEPAIETKPESKWDEIKEICMIAGVEDHVLNELEKIYNIGFRHGSEHN